MKSIIKFIEKGEKDMRVKNFDIKNRVAAFFAEEDGMGVVEVVLIIIVIFTRI